MTQFTKADIDELVGGLPRSAQCVTRVVLCEGSEWVAGNIIDVCRALYLAAGLNADGSEKAKVVKATLVPHDNETRNIIGNWDGTTFTPDGAE